MTKVTMYRGKTPKNNFSVNNLFDELKIYLFIRCSLMVKGSSQKSAAKTTFKIYAPAAPTKKKKIKKYSFSWLIFWLHLYAYYS